MSGASLPSWAVRGARVVCVDASRDTGSEWFAEDRIEKGAVYTITAVWVDSDGLHVVSLEGRDRSVASAFWGEPCGYLVWRFRPAVPRKTEAEDVAMFHDIARQKLPEAV